MFKVRFHLASGPNFKSWQIKEGKEITFHDPHEVNLCLFNCRLRNRRAIAEKIFYGENKSVCAWIECEQITVLQPNSNLNAEGVKISYNPRISPYWVMNGQDVDGQFYEILQTYGENVFFPKFSKI